ncbi:MAG: hypothetical protein U0514_01365 [Candidatus Andersenbacteria bacterium]
MREAGPGPSRESHQHEERKATVLGNLRMLDGYARDALANERWTPYETHDGHHFSGVEIKGYFDTQNGRLTSIGEYKERVPAYWSTIRMFMGAPRGKTVMETMSNYPRIAEWAVPKSVSERYPEAMAGLGASFQAFELDRKRRHAEQQRPL